MDVSGNGRFSMKACAGIFGSMKRMEEQVKQKRKIKAGRESLSREERLKQLGRTGRWFQTICFIHVPVVGFFYLLVLAIRKNTPDVKKDFARAYLLYRILVLILALVVLLALYRVGLDFIDGLLRYAKIR